ncbi:Conserved_hypothetical protein [Hexamita inflata]|uniref:Uncharacterized protein n=1 Tax=Hexamita inflata TaxID=28002 RepID=A0ABP1GKY6_9EUKA
MNFESPSTKQIYEHLNSFEPCFTKAQLYIQFQWFNPHLTLCEGETAIGLLVDQLLQFRVFRKTFNLLIKQEEAQVCFSPVQLTQFCNNYLNKLIKTRLEYALDLLHEYFNHHFTKDYQVEVNDDLTTQILVKEGKQNVFYMYFLLLVLIRICKINCKPKDLFVKNEIREFKQVKMNSTDLMENTKSVALLAHTIDLNNLQECQKLDLQTMKEEIKLEKEKEDLENCNNKEKVNMQPNLVSENKENNQQDLQNIDLQNEEYKQALTDSQRLIDENRHFIQLQKQNNEHDSQTESLLLIKDSKLIFLTNENYSLKKQLADYIEYKDNLQRSQLKLKEQQETIEQLEIQNQLHTTQIKHLSVVSQQFDKMKAQFTLQQDLQQQNQQLSAQNENYLKQINNFKLIVNEKSDHNLQLSKQVQSLTEQLNKSQQHLNTNKQQTQELITVCTEKNQQLIIQLQNKDNLLIELQTRLQQRSTNQAEFEAAHLNKFSTFQDKILQMENNAQKLREQNGILQQKLNEFQHFKEKLVQIEALSREETRKTEVLTEKMNKSKQINKQLREKCEQFQKITQKQAEKYAHIHKCYKELYGKHEELLQIIQDGESAENEEQTVPMRKYNQIAAQYVTVKTQLKQTEEKYIQRIQKLQSEQFEEYQHKMDAFYKQSPFKQILEQPSVIQIPVQPSPDKISPEQGYNRPLQIHPIQLTSSNIGFAEQNVNTEHEILPIKTQIANYSKNFEPLKSLDTTCSPDPELLTDIPIYPKQFQSEQNYQKNEEIELELSPLRNGVVASSIKKQESFELNFDFNMAQEKPKKASIVRSGLLPGLEHNEIEEEPEDTAKKEFKFSQMVSHMSSQDDLMYDVVIK